MANVALNSLSFENVLTTGAFNVSGAVNYHEKVMAPNGTYDPDVTNPNPASVQVDQDAFVRFNWNQNGILTTMLAGKWKLDVFFEQMGPSEGPAIPSKLVPYESVNPKNYSVDVQIPAGTISEGLYRVTARLMLLPTATPGLSPICAFTDLGLIQYFNG